MVTLGNLSKTSAGHSDSGEGLWLQGEAELQAQSFRDAEPQPVTLQKRKNHEMSPKLLRPGITIRLKTTDPCLPINAWK